MSVVRADRISQMPGLVSVRPQGAMYVMVRIDTTVLDVRDDRHFTECLMAEESVFVLPGSCFHAPSTYVWMSFCSL
jgi:tyrosine aminotransferase